MAFLHGLIVVPGIFSVIVYQLHMWQNKVSIHSIPTICSQLWWYKNIVIRYLYEKMLGLITTYQGNLWICKFQIFEVSHRTFHRWLILALLTFLVILNPLHMFQNKMTIHSMQTKRSQLQNRELYNLQQKEGIQLHSNYMKFSNREYQLIKDLQYANHPFILVYTYQ